MVLSLEYRLLEYDPLFLFPNWNYIARFDRKTIAPAKSFYSRNRKRKQTWKLSIDILSNCPGVENPTIICDFRKPFTRFAGVLAARFPARSNEMLKSTRQKRCLRVYGVCTSSVAIILNKLGSSFLIKYDLLVYEFQIG